MLDGVFIIFTCEMGVSAFRIVNQSAAQLFKSRVFTGHCFDHRGTCDEHMACVFDHENEISHSRRIDRTAGTGSHDG